jgi:hypothetical protein
LHHAAALHFHSAARSRCRDDREDRIFNLDRSALSNFKVDFDCFALL